MRWGFIGASNIAERVIRSLRTIEGQDLVGVCSRNAARASEFAAAQGLRTVDTDLGEFLATGGFDAVYISSTNEQHCAQTLAALDAGCHVMCEKPLAMTEADALRMVRHAAACGRVLATNHHLRAQAAHRTIRDLIAAGEIGTVHGVQVSHAVLLPPHLRGWRLDAPGAGGGVVLDILVHNADLLRYLLGRDPLSIQTRTQHNGLAGAAAGPGAPEDGAMSLIEFEGGLLAQTHESYVAAHASTRLHVLGTQGTLYAVGSLTQAGTAELWQRDARGERPIPLPPVDLYAVGFSAFIDACAGRGQPLSSGLDGAWALATALAGLRAAAAGAAMPVRLPL